MIKPLTSLRFFFAFMVLLSHFPFPFNNVFYKIFSNGSVGVSFFFILSGFILTHNYEARFASGYNKQKFWLDRIIRIYPVHIIFLSFFALFFICSGNLFPNFFLKYLSHFFLIQNYIPIKDVYSNFNKPSWSICCELFFYFLFPFLVLRIRKNTLLFLILILVFPIILYLINNSGSMYIGISPFFRLPDFIVGIFSYKIYTWAKPKFKDLSLLSTSVIEVASIVILVSSLYLFSGMDYYRVFPIFWLPMVVFIIVMSLSTGTFSKIISHKIFIYLGEISYSIYMSHYLIITLATTYLRDSIIFKNRISALLFIVLITIIISSISYHLIEMKLGKKLKSFYYKKLKIS
ncbi:acyltransferase [Soonwooa sp.]|uniref:acyltransferase family protein n=1 Tax=Soonwooa sp. TaxID=1938592 RepID=UPI0034439972